MQIKVPRFNSNDDKVTLVEWLVKSGDIVKKGQPIAIFETTKAVIEYETEEAGMINILVKPKEVMVGDIIGEITLLYLDKDKQCHLPIDINKGIDTVTAYYIPITEEKIKKEIQKIGENVIINGFINANHLEIGDNSIIDGNIEADTVIIGKNCHIGRNNDFHAHKIIIGDNFRSADNVKIDVSGGITKESVFIAGEDCLLCMDTYVNCCREVILGNHVCLSPRSMVFTHRYWQDVRRGYDTVFNKVTFEDDSWLGANAVVMPGITVGVGSIVMAGSTVTENVVARTLVGGVPAVRIRQIQDKDNFDEKKFNEFVRLREEYFGVKLDMNGPEYFECLRRFGIKGDI